MSERTIASADERITLRLRTYESGTTPFALVPDPGPDAEPEQVADLLLGVLGGWSVRVTDPALREALGARHARMTRHSTTMRHTFGASSWPAAPVPGGVRLEPLSDDPTQLLAASLAAFPVGHRDRAPDSTDEDEAQELKELLAGDIVGPLIPGASRAAMDGAGRAVGGVIVTRMDDDASGDAGPWIAWILAHPEWAPPGTGSALLDACLTALAAGGESHVGLGVTVGNPAERLYRRFGFSPVAEGFTLTLPG